MAGEALSLIRGTMKLPLYQVDAFTGRLFGGNPAAVLPAGHWTCKPATLTTRPHFASSDFRYAENSSGVLG
jgi:hypothetical protein